MDSIRHQLRANLVALISLLVAVSTLGYSAWRQELTENNRSQREAAFAKLRTAEELQSVVDFAHYDGDRMAGNPIKGWGKVLYLRDLGIVMPAPVQARTRELQQVWARDWEALEHDEAAAQRITASIEGLRGEVRVLILRLK
jgi:hypothetical protein